MPASNPAPPIEPPTITWPDTGTCAPAGLAALACPNCGSGALKTYTLTIELHAPDDTFKRLHVVGCPDCGCSFYDQQSPPDYAAPAMVNRGRVPFYVQQGAGVSLITRPLAQVQAPPGSAYLEVGCGYGFGLDYAIRTKGWQGRGIDPAALSALGRDALQLPIDLRYLRDDDEARGSMAVVMGSEVIEHVTSPAAFIRTLRAMLRPGGVLILTTPNGDDISPASPPGVIVPLLSPSLHLVIQTSRSLHRLLREAGFTAVEIEVDSHSLVAFASDAPLALAQDPLALRTALRLHLLSRAQALDPSTDLFLGFAGRALQEAVNDQDMKSADAAWEMLVPACQARFNLDLDRLTALPAQLATCDLEEMAGLVPLNLGGILYARAIRRLSDGFARPTLEPLFTLAASAARAMRRALGLLAMEDGQTEEIEWTARAEAALCAAAANASGAIECLASLPAPPSGGPARQLLLQQRALSEWVNAGHDSQALEFLRLTKLDDAEFANASSDRGLDDAARDCLFALAMLELRQPQGMAQRVQARLARVRAASVPGSGLWFAALDGELRAMSGSGPLTDPIEQRQALQNLLFQDGSAWDAGDDRAIGLASRVLIDAINTGDLEGAGKAWAVLRPLCLQRYGFDLDTLKTLPGGTTAEELAHAAPPQLSTLLYARAIRQLLRGAARRGLEPEFAMAAEASAQWCRALAGRASQDGQAADIEWTARAEAALCAAAADLPGTVRRLETLDAPSPERKRQIQLRAVSEWVNAGHYTSARAYAQESGLVHAAFADPAGTLPLSDIERDALFGLAVLDVQTNAAGRPTGELAPARGRFARVRGAAVIGEGLWWGAVQGEVQALDLMDARSDAVALLHTLATSHPDLQFPPALASRLAEGG